MPADAESNTLSPLTKIAVVIASMDNETSVKILKHLPPQHVQQITAEVRSLGEITPQMLETAYNELSGMLREGINRVGGHELARKLLQEVVGDEAQASEMLEEASSDRAHAFSAIRKVNGKDLANLLSKEQPSTAAIILAFMPSKKAGEVMMSFDEDFREEIITRLAQRRMADPQIVERIERIFMDKVISLLHTMKESENDFLGGPQFVADMFQHVDRDVEETLMETLTEVSKDVAEEIRDLMFTFEDITKLTDQDIQKVLREVPMDKLQIALRGVPEEIFEKITNNLSKRAKENLIEEMELSGKIKRKEVEAEQRSIVATIRALEAAGEIEISAGGDDDAYL